MKRTLPSQEFDVGRLTTRHVHRDGPHVITTEAQTLDQALDIISAHQSVRRGAEKRRQSAKVQKPTLRQEIAQANLSSSHKGISLASGVVIPGHGTRALAKIHGGRVKRPHPFRDLPDQEKASKSLEMFRSKAWGVGARAGRKLAVLFGVSNAQMASWLGIEIWTAADFNAVMVARKSSEESHEKAKQI